MSTLQYLRQMLRTCSISQTDRWERRQLCHTWFIRKYIDILPGPNQGTLFYNTACEQPRTLSMCTMQLRWDQSRCGVRHGIPRGGVLDGPLLETGTQDTEPATSLRRHPLKHLAQLPMGQVHLLMVISWQRGKKWWWKKGTGFASSEVQIGDQN